MTKRYYWLKLSSNFFKDKRIKKLRGLAGGDTYTIIYQKMLLLSLEDGGRIYFDGVEDTFVKELALEIDENEDNVSVTVAFLMAQGLLEEVNESEYNLPGCEEMTGCESASAERMRRLRKIEKASHCDTNVRLCDADVTTCDKNVTTEIEIEIEIEKEKDIEKELEKEKEKDILILSNESIRQTDVRRVLDEWNTLTVYGIAQVSKISSSSTRYTNLKARIKEHGTEKILAAIDNIRHSAFLQGRADAKQWVITFDWFVKPNNFCKVLDGNYTDRTNNRLDVVDTWV